MALISSMQLKRCTDIQSVVHFFSMQTPTCEFSAKTNLCLEINSLSFCIQDAATAEIIDVICRIVAPISLGGYHHLSSLTSCHPLVGWRLYPRLEAGHHQEAAGGDEGGVQG